MLAAKYGTDSYEMPALFCVLRAIDSHTWQSTHLHQTKLLSEIEIVFFFYIHASDLLCNVTLLSGCELGLHQTFFFPPTTSLSLSLPPSLHLPSVCLSKSVNLFPNCKSSVGARAFFSGCRNIKSMLSYISSGFNFYLILMGMNLALSIVKDILLQIPGLYIHRTKTVGKSE